MAGWLAADATLQSEPVCTSLLRVDTPFLACRPSRSLARFYLAWLSAWLSLRLHGMATRVGADCIDYLPATSDLDANPPRPFLQRSFTLLTTPPLPRLTRQILSSTVRLVWISLPSPRRLRTPLPTHPPLNSAVSFLPVSLFSRTTSDTRSSVFALRQLGAGGARR